MKKVIWSLMFCLFMAANAAAQPGPGSGPDRRWEPPSPEQRADRLAEELSLDDKQTASLVEIFTAADAERDAMRQQHEKQMREEFCSHKDKVTGQIKSVLNEEQSAEFDKLMARREARWEDRGEHRKGRQGGHHKPFMNCEDPAT